MVEVFRQITDQEPEPCSFCGVLDVDRFYIANPDFTCTLCGSCIKLAYNALNYATENHEDDPPSSKKLN